MSSTRSSFLYAVGDRVVVVTWRARDRRLNSIPIEADVLERKLPDPNNRFPLYRVRLHMARGAPVEDWLNEHNVLGMAGEFARPTHRFFQLIAQEPLLTYFRVSLPAPRWPSLRKQMIAVMTAVYRVNPRDIIEITSIDGTEDADQAVFAKRLDRAFAGDSSVVPKSALYDLDGTHVTLVRKAAADT